MPQFVLLLHECPAGVPRPTHWDLMLQVGEVLRTWVLDELPAAWTAPSDTEPSRRSAGDSLDLLTAEEIQPHRIEYLDLEGPLSGDRGLVRRIDRGRYEALDISDRRVRVQLCGERIRGLLELARSAAATPLWHLRFAEVTRTRE